MEICELKNKIPEVLAYARTVSKRNGHTGKYAKHIVALVVKQTMHFTGGEVFSRLKEVFGLSKNRFVGIEKVAVHIYSCLIAYIVKYM